MEAKRQLEGSQADISKLEATAKVGVTNSKCIVCLIICFLLCFTSRIVHRLAVQHLVKAVSPRIDSSS